tara:strand:+ start:422 stop:1903 length:1482 start_codon:yes stop_codon:yes gene_type:complete
MDKLKNHYQLYINGEWKAGSEGQIMQSLNPHNNQSWASFDCADKKDIDTAVKGARKALNDPSWRPVTATDRGKLLYKLADLIEENAENIGKIETQDSGKLLAETVSQTKYVSDYYRYFAGLADKIEGSTLPIDKKDMHVYTTHQPIGVVAAIVPWNAQMFLTATKLAPAIAAGCSVIIKASEISPCAMFELAKLIEKAGFPKGVVSVITGDANNCSIPLTSHPDIDRIAFTGGTETAKEIIKNSSNNFAATNLELGGKSPLIVFEDADIESAANGIIAGNFGASGQSCVAGSRVIVEKNVASKLIELIKQKSQKIVLGNPLDNQTNLGPLCTKKQIELIEETIQKSIKQGGDIIFGGKRVETEGNYFEPTLIHCPDQNIETLKIEMFGPVISIIEFEGEKQAIELANDSKYGLGSGLFTKDLARAHRVSQQIKAGICWVNTYRIISPIAAFGGFNQSGYAREAGKQSVLDYTRTKTTWINLSDKPMLNPFVMR